MSAPRVFTPEEDELVRGIGRREIAFSKVRDILRCADATLYRRMTELAIPHGSKTAERQHGARKLTRTRLTAEQVAERWKIIADCQAKGMTPSQIAKIFATSADSLGLWMDHNAAKQGLRPRKCLCCQREFPSEGKHNRLCYGCGGHSLSPMAPDPGGGTGRRKPTGIGRH